MHCTQEFGESGASASHVDSHATVDTAMQVIKLKHHHSYSYVIAHHREVHSFIHSSQDVDTESPMLLKSTTTATPVAPCGAATEGTESNGMQVCGVTSNSMLRFAACAFICIHSFIRIISSVRMYKIHDKARDWEMDVDDCALMLGLFEDAVN